MSSTLQHDLVTVHLPAALIPARAGRCTPVQVTGATVREVVVALEDLYPGLQFHLCLETGDLRPFINVFVNGTHVRYIRGLDTPVSPGATVHIIQSVAGG